MEPHREPKPVCSPGRRTKPGITRLWNESKPSSVCHNGSAFMVPGSGTVVAQICADWLKVEDYMLIGQHMS